MFIAVPVLMLWYTAHAVLSRLSGTCTMGDTDRFVAGMIVGMPAAVVAVPLLLLAPARTDWRMGAVFATGLLAVVVLCLWVPLAVSAGIQGHHLCGSEFDEYLVATSGWERLIPLAHVAVASVLLGVGFRNVRRAWGAAQPDVEPAGRLRGRGLTP
jgi:hypothetical protein